tara:strand:- start:9980 stop:13546 length:3567 start_codon:yes stop_codon:yes gene_type:complete
MATYIKGVTDYIPVLEPFKPDYKFLSDVLSVRQDRYDTNFKSLNNLYSKVVYAPLTREDNKQRREQYSNKISNGLKQVSGLDLSLQQNVDVAKGVFKPFFEDKALIKDMAFTKSYQTQMGTANRLRTDSTSDKYWDIGVQGLQMQMEKFRDGTAEEAAVMGMPNYIANPNLYKKSFDALKDSGLEIKQTTLEGDWIVTTKNGTALTNHITGYEREEDGTLKYDDNKQPIPIVTNPAAEYLANTVMKDPSVRAAYMLEAQVLAYNFGKENAEQYGGREQAEAEWAKQTIEKYGNEQTQKLVEDNAVYNKALTANNNWKEYKKRNKISPKSSAEEALLLSQYNLNIAKANKEATEQRVKEIKSPASDQNSLMNIAYSAYMGGNMAPKMMQAAKAYSLVGAERTLKANPFKQLERQHQFALSRMAAQHEFDMAKMAQKFIYDAELQNMKNQASGNSLMNNLFSNVDVVPGDESISGDPMDAYDMFAANNESKRQEIRARNGQVKELFDLMTENLSSDFIGTAGYQGSGQYKYTVYNSQYPNGQEVTGTIDQMFAALDPVEVTDEVLNQIYENQPATKGKKKTKEEIRLDFEGYNQANIQEMERKTSALMNMLETTNPNDSESSYVTLSDGSVVNLNFPSLTENANGAEISRKIGMTIENINMMTDAIINADAQQNKVYRDVAAFVESQELAQGNLSAGTSYARGGSDANIDVTGEMTGVKGAVIQEEPGIVLTEGMINMLKQGAMPWQVNFAHKNGKLEEPFKDVNGDPVYRMLSREEYANLFADVMYGTETERAAMMNQFYNTGSIKKDNYDFFTREKNAGISDDQDLGFFGNIGRGLGFIDDYEWRRSDFWGFEGYTEPGVQYYDLEDRPERPEFDREKAYEKGLDRYDEMIKNMKSTSTRASADNLELTFDRRAFMRGLPEFGDQILENQYKTSFDVANPNVQSVGQFKDLYNVVIGTPKADIRISYGDTRASSFENQPDNLEARNFVLAALNDFRKGIGNDKTQSRFFVTDTYVEKAGGIDQPGDQPVAARYIQFSPEFLKERKSNLSDKAFAQVQKGFTIMYGSDRDNNPYASKNQIINQVETVIRNEGKYESPFIANGGFFTFFTNSKGQFVQQMHSFGVDPTTGNIVPDKPEATLLTKIVDPKELDALKVDLQSMLYQISIHNIAAQKKIQNRIADESLEEASE